MDHFSMGEARGGIENVHLSAAAVGTTTFSSLYTNFCAM